MGKLKEPFWRGIYILYASPKKWENGKSIYY
jgi:hypothetical protein